MPVRVRTTKVLPRRPGEPVGDPPEALEHSKATTARVVRKCDTIRRFAVLQAAKNKVRAKLEHQIWANDQTPPVGLFRAIILRIE